MSADDRPTGPAPGEALDAGTVEWIARQRWFATKSRRILGATVDDRLRVGPATLTVVRLALEGGGRDRYVLALGPDGGRDAFDEPAFCRAMLQVIELNADLPGERGALRGRRSRGFPPRLPRAMTVRRVPGEQSNTSVVFEDALIMKSFRRLVDGLNPDLEVTRFLTDRTTFCHTPRLAGAIEYVGADGGVATLAVAQELVRDARDGWQWMLERLAAGADVLPALTQLGRRTAELHIALATPTAEPAFGVEPITRGDVAVWAAAIEGQIAAARAVAGASAVPALRERLDGALTGLIGAAKSRHHGDFHLGQTLVVADGADVMLIDFEGEPLRPLEERRRKHTPLRDVAGMLRSLAYAAGTAARAGRDAGDWEARARRAFVEAYLAAAGRAAFIPATHPGFVSAVAALEIEKAAYEIVYEANNRPDWLEIPLRGFVSATEALGRAAGVV
jgi:trehalose synthase-fused probable maltokinase